MHGLLSVLGAFDSWPLQQTQYPSTPAPGPGPAGDVPVYELLSMLGVFGCLWSAAQGLPLELHTLRAAEWAPSVLLPFLGFAACMFAFYRCAACLAPGAV